MQHPCIHIEGGIINAELFDKIEQGELGGQTPADFRLNDGAKVRDEISRAWSVANAQWKVFNLQKTGSGVSASGAAETRKYFMIPLLGMLGYDLSENKTALIVVDKSYAISHHSRNTKDFPVHIMGFRDSLDVKRKDSGPRLSPHGLVQEYINLTEQLYAIVTNGFQLRLLRDNSRLIKLSYLEFDLERMFEEEHFNDFALLYRLLHASRFYTDENTATCLFEKYHQDSVDAGNRIREKLSKAVEHSLRTLGNGFIRHARNESLRAKFSADKSNHENEAQLYRQLRRLIYRLLFLMVTEERDLIFAEEEQSDEQLKQRDIYHRYYSIARLRKLCEQRFMSDENGTDVWLGMLSTFRLFEAEAIGMHMGIHPLDGDLFNPDAIGWLEQSFITNKLLLECIRSLHQFTDKGERRVRINYGSLDVEELGSVYEGLLELQPVVKIPAGEALQDYTQWDFDFFDSYTRKETGSYYTRPDLVHELIKSALVPVIEERLNVLQSKTKARNAQTEIAAKEKSLLSLKVCDPSAGSGHILLAAARCIAWYLARIRSGEEHPSPKVYRQAVREVIQHCIYGVDKNKDAVELCRLALWLEGHNSGKPLSYLQHQIRWGDSLVGVTDLKVLDEGLPDEAFNPIAGDNKIVCAGLKKANRSYLKQRQSAMDFTGDVNAETARHTNANNFEAIQNIEQNTVEEVKAVSREYEQLRKLSYNDEVACHIYTGAFFYNYKDVEDPALPTSQKLNEFIQSHTKHTQMAGAAVAIGTENNFFHWAIEFPHVFEQGGFDVMLGNPPWERIKLQEKEFFASRDINIANAPNKAEREKLIKELPVKNPHLLIEFQNALHSTEANGKFLREGRRFPLTSKGDINTYAVFAELFAKLINKEGRAGLIIPAGIASDNTTKDYFSFLIDNSLLVQLIGFENEEFIFPTVHHAYKFCALTISGKSQPDSKAKFTFFNRNFNNLQDKQRYFQLSKDDFELLNPNTKTCPVFRTGVDASLTIKIYKRNTVLINDVTGENLCGVSFMSMFHMSNDSHLFQTREQLLAKGFQFSGHKMKSGDEVWLPLVEAKLIHQYNHRYSTFENANQRDETENVVEDNLADPSYSSHAWYYVHEFEVTSRTKEFRLPYLMGFRDITNATNERTTIVSALPLVGATGIYLTFLESSSINHCVFLSNLNSLVFDFVTRQKIGGMHLSQNYTKQLPVVPPAQYTQREFHFIIPRVMELTYTAWDMQPFAEDVWKEADAGLRAAISLQWEENQDATGGHEGKGMIPFKWDDERRAVLKAELDAYYAKLYGLTEEELRYILCPQDVYGEDFPGETFRVLKDKETRKYGEYRTKRLVLEAWGRLNGNANVINTHDAVPKSNSIDLKNIPDTMKEFSLHEGIYSVRDVVNITHLNSDKVRRWFKELSKAKYEGLNSKVQSDIEKWRISFHGLIELVVIGTLRENDVTLKKILEARAALTKITKKIYPFATNNVKENLHVAGKSLTFNLPTGEIISLDGKGQFNLDIIKAFFKHIEFDLDGVAQKLFPLKNSKLIVVDPKQAGGKAVISNKGVWAETIAQFYTGPDSIPMIQQQYELEEEEVLAAIEYRNN